MLLILKIEYKNNSNLNKLNIKNERYEISHFQLLISLLNCCFIMLIDRYYFSK